MQQIRIRQFLQFIFILVAASYVAPNFGLGELVDALRESSLTPYLLYIGTMPIATCMIIMLIRYRQQRKAAGAERHMKKLDAGRQHVAYDTDKENTCH